MDRLEALRAMQPDRRRSLDAALLALERDPLVVVSRSVLGVAGRLRGSWGDRLWELGVGLQCWRYRAVLEAHLRASEAARGLTPAKRSAEGVSP